jgi:hypothetical protein
MRAFFIAPEEWKEGARMIHRTKNVIARSNRHAFSSPLYLFTSSQFPRFLRRAPGGFKLEVQHS